MANLSNNHDSASTSQGKTLLAIRNCLARKHTNPVPFDVVDNPTYWGT
jgi:hypothetical protein